MLSSQHNLLLSGEFAQLCGVNKKTILYYDQIGLFKPSFTAANGYRYYSYQQLPFFYLIKTLLELGMSLHEIQAYIDNKSPENLLSLLQTQSKAIETKLTNLKNIRRLINNKIKALQSAAALTDTQPQLINTPCEHLIISSSVSLDDSNATIHSLIKQHIDYCKKHIASSSYPIGAMFKRPLEDRQYYMYSKTDRACRSLRYYHEKPAGCYLTAYLKGDYWQPQPVYEQMHRYIAKHKLTTRGYFYEESLYDELSSSDIKDYLTRISVQIEPAPTPAKER